MRRDLNWIFFASTVSMLVSVFSLAGTPVLLPVNEGGEIHIALTASEIEQFEIKAFSDASLDSILMQSIKTFGALIASPMIAGAVVAATTGSGEAGAYTMATTFLYQTDKVAEGEKNRPRQLNKIARFKSISDEIALAMSRANKICSVKKSKNAHTSKFESSYRVYRQLSPDLEPLTITTADLYASKIFVDGIKIEVPGYAKYRGQEAYAFRWLWCH